MIQLCDIPQRQDIVTLSLNDGYRIDIKAHKVSDDLIDELLPCHHIFVFFDVFLDGMCKEHTGATGGVEHRFVLTYPISAVFYREIHKPFNGIVFTHQMA